MIKKEWYKKTIKRIIIEKSDREVDLEIVGVRRGWMKSEKSYYKKVRIS